MNHLPFTLTAYFFNALAVLANKFLLNKAIPDPAVYIFYISLFSLLAILALPFTKIPTIEVFNLASLSTLLWTAGAYFMFKALKIGQVSRVIPVIGTAIPIILLVFASRTNVISITQAQAVAILTLGIVVLTITDWRGKLSKREIVFEILSAASFAFSYIILREAYLKLDFFSVLVWSRLILLLFCFLMLAVPILRAKIITPILFLSSRRMSGSIKMGLIFLGGQVSGALSEFLILFSISLANPALVNSLQGTQYVFLLLFGREKYTPFILLSKIAGIGLLGIGLYLLAFANG